MKKFNEFINEDLPYRPSADGEEVTIDVHSVFTEGIIDEIEKDMESMEDSVEIEEYLVEIVDYCQMKLDKINNLGNNSEFDADMEAQDVSMGSAKI